MSPRARWGVLAVLLVVFGVTVVMAGKRGEPAATGPLPTGVQRLGPEAGEPVADYLRRAYASLPEGNAGPVWALVQLDSYLASKPAAQLAQGVRLSRVVLRVPLPRVQTALITRDLPGQRTGTELTEVQLVRAMKSAAQDRLAATYRQVPPGRLAAVAAAETAQLRDGCACVLALLVLGDGEALRAVAAHPGVRAVHAASPDTAIHDVAISALLPEQVDMAGPVPDDGPVPGYPAAGWGRR
ncbi:MAG: hypothetical protein M3186_06000 [Actinomycetota bacterium]|nr:hypothetical protein [Actinomycetota bacterium]